MRSLSLQSSSTKAHNFVVAILEGELRFSLLFFFSFVLLVPRCVHFLCRNSSDIMDSGLQCLRSNCAQTLCISFVFSSRRLGRVSSSGISVSTTYQAPSRSHGGRLSLPGRPTLSVRVDLFTPSDCVGGSSHFGEGVHVPDIAEAVLVRVVLGIVVLVVLSYDSLTSRW